MALNYGKLVKKHGYTDCYRPAMAVNYAQCKERMLELTKIAKYLLITILLVVEFRQVTCFMWMLEFKAHECDL